LEAWSLEICTVQDPSIGLAASQDTFRSCALIDGSVTVTTGTGFNGNVSLSIESSISGVDLSLDQSTIPAGSSTNLNFEGTLAKNEVVIISATDGTVEVNKNIFLERSPSPEEPTLISPADMSMNLSADVNLSWQSAMNASSYRYQISNTEDFSNVITSNTVSSTMAAVNLASGGDYYWRVQSINECDTLTSDIRVFNVSDRFNVDISELNITTCQSTVEYLITITGGVVGNVNAAISNLPSGTTAAFENNPAIVGETIKIILSDLPTTANSYDLTLTLTDDTGMTDLQLGLTVEVPPGLPTLTSPENNMADVDTIPSFQFDLGSSATIHDLEVATDEGFSDIVILAENLTSGNVSPEVLLMPNTRYYWRVKGSNSCGVSFSPIFQFKTKIRTSTTEVFDGNSIQLIPNPTRQSTEIVIRHLFC